MKALDITGILPAVLTPYDKEGAVDRKLLIRLLERLLARGASGLFVCGTTGEFPFLTTDERQMIVETALEVVAGRVPVLVHVGALRTADTVQLARHAERAGAHAVSSVPPFYYGYSADAVVDHAREVGEATSLPFLYYHIPPRTGVALDLGLLERLLDTGVVSGIKYSSGDLVFLRQALQLAGAEFSILCGLDEILLPALLYGAKGGVGSSYNVLMAHYHKLWEHYEAGRFDDARKLQYAANRVIDVLVMDSNIAVTKEALRLCGLDLGLPRKPQTRLDEATRRKVSEALEAAGLWQLEGVRE